MTIEELRVLITVKTDGLQEGIDKAKSRLKGFGESSQDADSAMGSSISSMQKNLDSLRSTLDETKSKIEITKDAINRLTEASSKPLGIGNYSINYSAAIDRHKEALAGLESTASATKSEIHRLQARMESLKQKSTQAKGEIQKLGGTMSEATKQSKNAGDRIKEMAKNASSRIKETAKNIGRLGRGITKASDQAKQSTGKITGLANTISRSFMQVVRRLFVYNLIYKAVRGLMNYMGGALKTNNQFVASLNQIKTNLMVAFQPIYDFILPAINALMRAIATVTTYIASAISALFGKTYKQSFNAAKGLNAAKKSMAGVGKATEGAGKKAKKAAKEMKGSLAGFDEINTLNTTQDTPSGDSGGSGGGGADPGGIGGIDIPPITGPSVDLSPVEESIKRFLDRFKGLLVPVKEALGRLAEAFKPLGKNIGEGLKWLLDNVLIPLGKWTITEIVPRFIDMLANVLTILNNVIEALKPWWKWLWDNFWKPLAEWTGGIILDVLDGLNNALKGIGDWISSHKKTIETLAIVIASIATSIGLVNAAMALWNGIQAISTAITWLNTYATTALGVALLSVNWPLVLITAAIAAVIAIGVLLWKNWDKISTWAGKLWQNIKDVFGKIGKWIGDTWDKAKNWTNEKWNNIKDSATKTANNIKDGISKTFGNIKDSISKTWDNTKVLTANAWSNIQSKINEHGGGIKGVIGTATEGYKKIWRTGWDTMNRLSGGKLGDMVTNIRNKMSDIKNKIANSGIGQAWDKIWNFKMPKIKLPHFNFSGKFSLNPPSVPKFKPVEWYDKGGIFTGPQIVGVGEKRPEFVGALDDLRKIVRDEIKNASGNGDAFNSDRENTGDIIIKVGEDEFARIAIKAINKRQRGAGGSLLLV